MSELQKKFGRLQRREGPGIGFGQRNREQPRAMLLGAVVNDEAAGKAALGAGADVLVMKAAEAAKAAGAVKKLTEDKTTVGVWTDTLDEASAEALSKAGCDFVISTLEGTSSAAVDTDRMGQLVVASNGLDDTTLRSLAPLGLDALFVERPSGAMTLAEQLKLVRLASFASTPLITTVEGGASVADLRVLRDSGVVAVILPSGASAEQIKGLVESLKAVPAPKRGKGDGREIALVPSLPGAQHEEEEEEEPDLE